MGCQLISKYCRGIVINNWTPLFTQTKVPHVLLLADITKKCPCNLHRKMFDFFVLFAQNIDSGYTPPRRCSSNEYIAEALLTSTHNLYLRAKIRKIGLPLQIPLSFSMLVERHSEKILQLMIQA